MELSLIAVGIGLLWGGSLLTVNRAFGDYGSCPSIILTGVSHVLLTMGAMYAVLSTDASFMIAGIAAVSIIALSLFSGTRNLKTAS